MANSAFGHWVKWYLAAWFFLSYGSDTLQKHAGYYAYCFRSFFPTIWNTLLIRRISKLRFRLMTFPNLLKPDINRFVTNSCSSSTGGLSGSSGYMEKIMNVPFYLYYNIKKENSFRHSLFYKLEVIYFSSSLRPSSLHITCYPSYLILSTSVSFFRLLLKTQESTICNRPTKKIILKIGTIGT